jgi:hypothetical protein
MDRKLIKRRRKAILAAAECESCGATLGRCEAQRGKDPTAPPWFGCCAQGSDLITPCRHVPSTAKLVALLKEIERGQVRDEATELLDSIEEYPMTLRRRVLAMVPPVEEVW